MRYLFEDIKKKSVRISVKDVFLANRNGRRETKDSCIED